jgi:uncharacterized protein (TIGR02246 family)
VVCIVEGFADLMVPRGAASWKEPVMTDDADRQVREVLKEVYAAWEANDADAFARPYAESVTATLPGIYLSGRQAVRDTMATLFAGELKGSRASCKVRKIRFVAADVAVVTSEGGVLFAGQAEPDAASRALETWVLSRQDGAWRVQAFHNCPQQVNRDAE